jgi:hypothetical protein
MNEAKQATLKSIPREIRGIIWSFLDRESRVAAIDAYKMFREHLPMINPLHDKIYCKLARKFIETKNVRGGLNKFAALGDLEYVKIFYEMDLRTKGELDIWYDDIHYETRHENMMWFSRGYDTRKYTLLDMTRLEDGKPILSQEQRALYGCATAALMIAIEKDREHIVKFLISDLKSGRMSVNFYWWANKASEFGAYKSFRVIFEQQKEIINQDPERPGGICLHYAAKIAIQAGHKDIVEFCVLNGADRYTSYLARAIRYRKRDITLMFLKLVDNIEDLLMVQYYAAHNDESRLLDEEIRKRKERKSNPSNEDRIAKHPRTDY